ncbi:MAG: nitrile hydratase accessory protein [Pseudomonadales bacterium]|nr:nitrile hydratase accessory protein [Pseudomonadales bacterium]
MSDTQELTGTLAPPMINGEVVFEAPWQGRVFGMARALANAGFYSWDDFRACLIRRIRDWDAAGHEGSGIDPYHYYDHFLQAFEDVLHDTGVVDPDLLGQRFDALAARPHAHDH